MTELTTPQAAERLGVTVDWINKLIRAGILSARKLGRDWLVDAESVANYQATRRPQGKPKGARNRMPRRDYTQYVHEYENDKGQTRYAVARWDPDKGQYIRPFDTRECKLTGCSAEFARRPAGVQCFASRKRALARARYLFRPDPDLED